MMVFKTTQPHESHPFSAKNYALRAGRKLSPIIVITSATPHSGDGGPPSRSHAAASSNQRPSPSRPRPGTSSICTGSSTSSGTRSASTQGCRAAACRPRNIFAGCPKGGSSGRDSGCERSDHERQRHRPSDSGSAPEPTSRPCRDASKGSVRKHRSRG